MFHHATTNVMTLEADKDPSNVSDIRPVSNDLDKIDEDKKEEELDINPLLPIHIDQSPKGDIFQQEHKGQYISIHLLKNFINARIYLRPDDNSSFINSTSWATTKNDIELCKITLILDKQKEVSILLQYCHQNNTLEVDADTISYSLGRLNPLPLLKTIYLPHVNVKNIVIDTGVKNDFIDTIDEKTKKLIMSIKLCDIKNNSEQGPMLIVEVNDIKNDRKMFYCKKGDFYKNKETELLQVRVKENKEITFSFPDITSLKEKREEDELRRKNRMWNRLARHVSRHLYIYCLIGSVVFGYITPYYIFQK